MGRFDSWPPKVEYDGTNRNEVGEYVATMASLGIKPTGEPSRSKKKPKKQSKSRLKGGRK